MRTDIKREPFQSGDLEALCYRYRTDRYRDRPHISTNQYRRYRSNDDEVETTIQCAC